MTLEIKLEDTIRNSVAIPHGLLDDNTTPDFNANKLDITILDSSSISMTLFSSVDEGNTLVVQ